MTLKTIQNLLSNITLDAELAKLFENVPEENVFFIAVSDDKTGAMINNNMHPGAALEAVEPLLKFAQLKMRECDCPGCKRNIHGVNLLLATLEAMSASVNTGNETKH